MNLNHQWKTLRRNNTQQPILDLMEKKEIKETHPTKPKSENKKKMMKEMNEEEDASLLE